MDSSWEHPEITEVIRRAIEEDVGSGDVTTEACVPSDAKSRGYFIAREPMVLAGAELLPQIYNEEQLEISYKSGDFVEKQAVIARIGGSTRRLLTTERTALNFLQRLSGIATHTRAFVNAVAGTDCQVFDTRKTTPGLRRLEKLAVKCGGGTNHRLGLFDAVLIKNNHITAAGGVRQALEQARSKGMPVEIEIHNWKDLDEALAAGAGHVLLDNFTLDEVRQAIRTINGRAKVEVSGGITLQNVRAFAETGADYLSSGALTHSFRSVDIAFRLENHR
jgi:nicotinate-nucleotide pyrophosphorylase (carboxylating)